VRVLYNREMTQSFNIPDSISSDDLEELMASAVADNSTKPSVELTHDELEELAHKTIEQVADDLNGAQACLVHKMMLHIMAMRMVEFHSRVSHQLFEDGRPAEALAWGRDGGKFQAVLNIMDTVSCSDDDPTCTVK